MQKLLLLGIALVAGIASGPSGAADLPASMSMKAPAMAPIYTWTGCYVGANAGAGSDRESFTNVNPRQLPNFDRIKAKLAELK